MTRPSNVPARSSGSLADKRVLVAGATGFLGANVCRRLCEQGAEVHGVARSAPGTDAAAELRFARGDLADEEFARELMARIKPDVVFHLACHGSGAPDLRLVLPTFRSDLATTVNLLTAATERGVGRMIVAASMEEPFPGLGEPTPQSPYSAAKWAGSGYARMFHALYGTPVAIVRSYMAYGPGQRPYKVIPHVICCLLDGEAPRLSSGRRRVDWVYVDDVVEGLLAAAVAPGIEGSSIDLGSGALVTVADVVRQIREIIGGPVEPLFGGIPDRPFEQERVADTTCAYEKLGWRARTPLRDGLQRTVEWYRARRALD